MPEIKSLQSSPQLVLAEQDRIAVVLSEKEVFSLYKKSRQSGIPLDILEEVYRRGYQAWLPGLSETPAQTAYNRVNSFIAGGLASDLDEDLKKTCWKGYEAIGMKKKNGKMVPNCVPVKEEDEIDEGLRDKAQKMAKVAGVVGALAGQGYKMADMTNYSTGSDPATAAASMTAQPYKKVVDLAKHVSPSKANSGENEFMRQKKFPTKIVREDAEKHSKNPDDPSNRFVGSNELVDNYKKSTPGQIVKRIVKEAIEEDAKGHFSPSGGMTQAGVDAYNRKTGGHLKTAVTTEPSKLKPGSKAAKRRKSFCARMGGMKKRLTSAKTARDPDSRINKSLRKWNCEETQTNEMFVRDPSGKKIEVKKQKFRGADNKMHSAYPGKSSSSGGGDE